MNKSSNDNYLNSIVSVRGHNLGRSGVEGRAKELLTAM